jgi:hypothetical protein
VSLGDELDELDQLDEPDGQQKRFKRYELYRLHKLYTIAPLAHTRTGGPRRGSISVTSDFAFAFGLAGRQAERGKQCRNSIGT